MEPSGSPAYLLLSLISEELDGNAVSSQNIQFTPREREIMCLIALGKTSKEIADELGISAKTVDVHRTNLMHKADLHNAAQVTAYAFKLELVKFQSTDS